MIYACELCLQGEVALSKWSGRPAQPRRSARTAPLTRRGLCWRRTCSLGVRAGWCQSASLCLWSRSSRASRSKTGCSSPVTRRGELGEALEISLAVVVVLEDHVLVDIHGPPVASVALGAHQCLAGGAVQLQYFFSSMGNATPAGPWPNGIREPGASVATESKHPIGDGSQGLAQNADYFLLAPGLMRAAGERI